MNDKEKNHTKNNGVNTSSETIGYKLSKAASQEQFVSRESVVQYLRQDVRSLYVLLSEILASEEIIDAIANVIYTRYEKIREAKESQQDLPFNAEK